ncbi:MAG TPA: CNNM domain-containing protein [Candidatus Angelobacter sp.]|nr:CNNM domain-containing protein [Candidatus Angelobacter sp.]
MNATELLTWVAFAVCLALSFLLSGMESGVFALSRMRVRQQMRAGRRSAQVLHGYLENPENFLWTILVGNTIANFIILGMVLVFLDGALLGRWAWFLVIFVVVVFLFYTLFDLLPKMLFRLYPNRLCLISARPFRIIHVLLQPLVWMVEGISKLLLHWSGGKAFTGHLFGNREELRFVMQESGATLTTEERAMINRVLDLQSMTVRRIVKPIGSVATATMEMPVRDVLTLSRDRRVTRLPVWETRDGRRRVAGIISVVTLLYLPNLDLNKFAAEFVRPALYVEEDMRLENALQRMQRSGQRMAVVLGRDQKEIGIITLTDILKLIFGEVSL